MKSNWKEILKIQFGKFESDFPTLEGYFFEYYWRFEYENKEPEVIYTTIPQSILMFYKLLLRGCWVYRDLTRVIKSNEKYMVVTVYEK